MKRRELACIEVCVLIKGLEEITRKKDKLHRQTVFVKKRRELTNIEVWVYATIHRLEEFTKQKINYTSQ